MQIPVVEEEGNKEEMRNPEPVVMPTVSRKISRAKELDAGQPQSRILTTSKTVRPHIIKQNEHQVKTTIPSNLPVPQDPESLNLKEQLLPELKLMLEKREHSWVKAQCTGLPPASDSLT